MLMGNKDHALLSASSSHRWLICTKSARLEQEFQDQSGAAAQEGTLAHEIAEGKLRKALGQPTNHPNPKPYDKAMDNHCDDYVAYILEQKAQLNNPTILIEKKVDFSEFVPEGFGTCDCLLANNTTLHLIDFKYGQGVLVEADNNSQMMLYALGALRLFPNAEQIFMTIYQPRRSNISTFEISTKQLLNWAEGILRPLAEQAFNGEGQYICGEHCQFCRAAVKCRARADEKLALAKHEFKAPPLLTDEEIEDILGKVDDLTGWANDVKSYALTKALAGKKWSGYKLVEGRANRKYSDENAVARALQSNGITDIYETKLLGLTAMEKKIGKTKFNEILSALLERPQGKPTLVPSGDKRQELQGSDPKSEFMEEI